MSKATSAERGAVYLTISKLFAIATGYLIYFSLARMLGPARFGIYGVVVGIISVLNMVVTRGTLQSVSKFVSENPGFGEAVKRASLKMALYIGLPIFIVYELSAGLIAYILNDPTYVPYLRLAGLIFLSYSFYGVIRGYVNGMRRFLLQASLEVIYNLLKLILVVGMVFLGYAVMGAIGGFAMAAFLLFIISILAVGFHEVKGDVSLRALINFNLIVMAIAFLENLLLQLDLIAVKALTPVEISNTLGGYYTAVLSIARLLYYAVLAFSFVIFPLVSHSTFTNNRKKTARYINGVMRYSLMVLAIMAVLFSTEAGHILSLLYSSTYAVGAPALSIAVFSLLAYSLLYVGLTILVAAGKPKIAFAVALAALVLDIVANIIFVPHHGMVGAAFASACAFFFGTTICAAYMRKTYSAFVPFKSLLRIGLAALIVFFISQEIVLDFPFWIGEMAILAGVYVVLLVVTREFNRNDFDRILKLIPR